MDSIIFLIVKKANTNEKNNTSPFIKFAHIVYAAQPKGFQVRAARNCWIEWNHLKCVLYVWLNFIVSVVKFTMVQNFVWYIIVTNIHHIHVCILPPFSSYSTPPSLTIRSSLSFEFSIGMFCLAYYGANAFLETRRHSVLFNALDNFLIKRRIENHVWHYDKSVKNKRSGRAFYTSFSYRIFLPVVKFPYCWCLLVKRFVQFEFYWIFLLFEKMLRFYRYQTNENAFVGIVPERYEWNVQK